MSVRDLPAEVLEEVVSAIPDRKSLPSLALVSRAFRQPSQRILFHYICLGDRASSYDRSPNPPPRHLLLKAILTENPTIATYIRDLVCTQTDLNLYSRSSGGSPILWMLDHGVLLGEIFQLLKHSRMQKITMNSFSKSLINWFNLHPTVQSGFLYLFNKPSLTSFTLSGWIIPQNIFTSFVNLRYLTLRHFLFSADRLLPIRTLDTSRIITGNGQPIHQLSSLEMDVEIALNTPVEQIRFLLRLDFTSISMLNLHITDPPLLDMRPFVSGSNLQVLAIFCIMDKLAMMNMVQHGPLDGGLVLDGPPSVIFTNQLTDPDIHPERLSVPGPISPSKFRRLEKIFSNLGMLSRTASQD
ncbi:hypothetical protein BDN72DRAFT_899503 [Pluteus cervinus]|uniref:Uncharacterized protein n=1 Tax=Pluteus cervinus TaxID=181527 RepID=A0ACD3AMS3_9AGAR|nr:hypothetical protein BDN72DRAFT_899503 [Pluteus cervinus]